MNQESQEFTEKPGTSNRTNDRDSVNKQRIFKNWNKYPARVDNERINKLMHSGFIFGFTGSDLFILLASLVALIFLQLKPYLIPYLDEHTLKTKSEISIYPKATYRSSSELSKKMSTSSAQLQSEIFLEKLFQGTVIENNLSCQEADVCYFRLLSNGEELKVIYNYGESLLCENERTSDIGKTLVENDVIEVFGLITDSHEVTTCDSQSYFIRKLHP